MLFRSVSQSRYEVLAEGLRRLDSFDVGSVPEGELAHEYEDLLADVGNERSQARKFLTGFPSVDRVTAGGIAPGELWFVETFYRILFLDFLSAIKHIKMRFVFAKKSDSFLG